MHKRHLGILLAILLVPVGVAANALRDGPLVEDVTRLKTTDGLELITSHAEAQPGMMVHVAVTQTQILVEGVPVISLENGPQGAIIPENETKGQLVLTLYDELLEHAERRKDLGSQLNGLLIGDPFLFNGKIALTLDRRVPFSTVRQVMYTAGQAQFGHFQFIVDNPFMHSLAAIESSLPAFGLPTLLGDEEEYCRPLNLSVFVSKTGLNIAGDLPQGTQTSLPCKSGTCGGVDDYSWDAFNDILGSIKDEYPYERTVIVVPDAGVSIEVLAKAIDYSRWAPMLPFGSDESTWHRWQTNRKSLFDTPVVAGGAQ